MDDRMFFPKNERLTLQKDIDRLFESGQTFVAYPLRIIYLPDVGNHHSAPGISVLISVPKKRIRLAVKRNKIKRLIRESYRLNKSETSTLFKQNGKQLHIAFLYISNDMKMYAHIEKAVQKTLEHIRSL